MSNSDKYKVPAGFRQLLEALAREVLRNQPNDIYLYGALFFERLLIHKKAHGDAALPLAREADYQNFKHDLFSEAQARGLLDSAVPSAHPVDVEKAATKIQAAFRGFEVRHHPEKFGLPMSKRFSQGDIHRVHLFTKPEKPIVKTSSSIQFDQQHSPEELAKEEAAAVKIQSEIRALIQRKKYEAMKKELNEAATKIQANFRGHLQRQEYLEKKHSASNSRSASQMNIHEHHDNGKSSSSALDEVAAAEKIQATYKGFKVRQEVKKEQEAATKIQATFRGHHVRKELHNDTNHSSDDLK